MLIEDEVCPEFIENSPFVVLRLRQYESLTRWGNTHPTPPQFLEIGGGVRTHVVILEDDFRYLMGNQPDPLLHIEMPRKGVIAFGAIWPDNGITVFEGSQVGEMAPKFPATYRNLRHRLEQRKVIGKIDGRMLFLRGYGFDNPSAAASIVTGNSADGNDFWKDKYGRSIKNLGLGNSR